MKRLYLLPTLTTVPLLIAACGQAQDETATTLTTPDDEPAYVVIGDKSTFLKKTTDDSTKLESGSEKCNIAPGTKLFLQSNPTHEGSHFLVNTKEMLPDCGFSKGYIFREHVAKSSLKSLFPVNVSAFLDTIGYAEGTHDRYDYMYTHKVFYSYAGHPRLIQCSYGLCSDAAGRYQFLSTTWDAMRRKLGLTDFSPASQDQAAVQLIKDVGCYNQVVNINGPQTFSLAAYCVLPNFHE